LLATPLAVQAQEVSGFGEVRLTWAAGAEGEPFTVTERIRPHLEGHLHERVLVGTTVEAGLSQGRSMQAEVQRTLEDQIGPVLDLYQAQWPEHTHSALGVSDSEDYLNVSRLYVDWYHPAFDLRVGRQALQWGSAQFLNPTDPYPELLLTEPWRVRRGVNAARVTLPIGDDHQVQGAVGANDTFDALRAAGRATANWAQTDWSVVAAYRQESSGGLVGVDIKGTAVVGFWFEGALLGSDLFNEDDAAVHEEVAVGVDYSFAVLQQLLISAQYYRNGTDGSGAPGVDVLTDSVALPTCTNPFDDQPLPPLCDTGGPIADPFAPVLASTNYGLANVMVGITQDVSTTVAWLQNFDDGTGLFLPTVSVRPFGAVDVSASAQVPLRAWGDGGEFSPREEDLIVSEPPVQLDFSGLVPAATLYLWTRIGF
jgi:hypothetical protein